MNIDWLKIFRESLRKAAGELMRIYASDKRAVEISRGFGGDMTLVADKASEDIIIEGLRRIPADIRIISEEAGEVFTGKNPRYTILLDPLDGSFNFKKGLLYFGISIFVMEGNGLPVAACVINVPQGTEYYAVPGGSYKNGIKLETEKAKNGSSLLLELSKKRDPEDLDFITRAIIKMKKVRAPGAVALDLCAVADGTFDCLAGAGNSRYLDVAAGHYILEKAGGVVTDFKGNPDIREGTELKAKNILACSNRDIHAFMTGSHPD